MSNFWKSMVCIAIIEAITAHGVPSGKGILAIVPISLVIWAFVALIWFGLFGGKWPWRTEGED